MDTANAVLSFFLPLVISLVKQAGWDDRVNDLIAVLMYFAWAVIVVVASGALANVSDFWEGVKIFGTYFVTTLVAGTVAYQMIWKAFGIDDQLSLKTSVVKPVDEDVVVTEG